MKNNKLVVFLVFFVCLVAIFGVYYALKNKDNKGDIVNENNIELISKHYNKYVKTNKETNLYDENNNVVGSINKDIELTLSDISISNETQKFKIESLNNTFYINYEDVDKIEALTKVDDRYKKYIPFNQNIVTNNVTSFYDKELNLLYTINDSFDLPIIVKDDNLYGVQYNDTLVFVKDNDVDKVIDNHNTDLNNASGVAVLNYHLFYDEDDATDSAGCREEICCSKAQFKSHLDYFKENNIMTLKMKEVEDYVDGKMRLPKSVLITIDDGGRTKLGVDMLTEYEMYGTIFLITSWYNPSSYYKTDYIELHSHSNNLHNGGKCPGGQGGEIKCLDKDLLLNDLKLTRDALNGTTYFCYPFYEYNDYSIEVLKEAGFTMAFAGEKGDALVHVGMDKMRLPRFVVVDYTTMNDLNNYFSKITN